MKLLPGESYLSGINITKIFVALEDQSVWALTGAGVVYYKKPTDTNFQIYPKTDGLIVKDVTGFNETEMFFLVAPDIIYHYENGVEKQIKALFSGVTRINGIAAINSRKSSAYYDYYPSIPNRDWIAVATNKHLYQIYRGEAAVTEQYAYANPPIDDEPNWEVTHSGFKSTDFRYKYPMGRCYNGDFNFVSEVQGKYYRFESYIPNGGVYPLKINCSLLSHQLGSPYIYGSEGNSVYNFWGTDRGLYVKTWDQCNQPARLLLDGDTINGLEDVYALTPLYKQNFVCVATNAGLFYTSSSVFDENNGYQNLNRITFSAEPLYKGLKINSVYAQTKEEASYDLISGAIYTTMCEKVIWSSTTDGVKKSYVLLDQDYYKGTPFGDLNYSKPPNNFSAPTYDLCGENTITVANRIPEVFKNQILIQWYKDDVELSDWIGKKSVVLKDPGIYYTKVTSLCENIYRKSVPITINSSINPEVTFNYPNEINLCENKTFTFNTLANPSYTYKWFKDEVAISGANSASYTTALPGNYKVEVSNCPSSFISSATAKINVLPVVAPVILANQRNYCEGVPAILSVDNPLGYKLRWCFEGTEITELENQAQITVSKPGNYQATFENANACVNASAAYRYFTEALPHVAVSRNSTKTLCFGESVVLTASSEAGVTYLWNTSETSKSITVRSSGNYSVQVFNQYGCNQQSNQEVVVFNQPLSAVEIPDTTICTFSGQQIKITAPVGYAYYSWNGLKGTSNEFVVNTSGTYQLVIEDDYGCTASSTFIVAAWCKEVTVPNTFTPNNDGVNDVWRIGGLEDDQTTAVFIYNRHGAEIYRAVGLYQPWDGKYMGNDMPQGTYYYIIRSQKSPKALTGSISIVR